MKEHIQNQGCMSRFTISKKKKKEIKNGTKQTKQNKTNQEQKVLTIVGNVLKTF